MTGVPCVVSAVDHAGWAHLVCVAAPNGVPTVVSRQRIVTIDAGIPTMPYHHETLRMSVADADALIVRVRQSVVARTMEALRETLAALEPAFRIVALAIRRPPFADLPDTVAVVRQSYQLQCAADGMIYQRALCRASRDLAVPLREYPRGAEFRLAADALGVSDQDIHAFIEAKRPDGPPWTAEHRRAFAAAIGVLADCTTTLRLQA